MVRLNKAVPKLKDGQWHRIEVAVTGENAKVKIDDKVYEVRHDRIAQKKSMVKLGFSFASISIRKFDLDQI